MNVTQAYRFALDPNPAQERALRSHAGAARFAWNWGLAKCNARYATAGKRYSAMDLHRLWNAEKKADPALSWWSENSKCAYQEAFRDLDRSLGKIRTHESSRKLARRLENGTARIRNLLNLAASGAERRNACRGTARPGIAGHVPLKQEPGTAQAGKTGTVPRQHGTAA